MIDQQIISTLMPFTEIETALLKDDQPSWFSDIQKSRAIIIDRYKMLSIGLMFNYIRHPRFLRFPAHRHAHVEMVVMIKGTSVHHVNNNTIQLKEGELLFLLQETLHEVEMLGKDDLAINIHILPEFFGNIFASLEAGDSVLRNFCLDALSGGNSGTFLHYSVSNNTRIQHELNLLIYNLLYKPKMYIPIVKSTFGLLFQTLQTCSNDLKTFIPDNSSIMPTVMRYVEENYDTGNLVEIAERIHCSPAYLSRFIKQSCNKNFTNLIQDRRMNAAIDQLINTDKNINDIATEIGYTNASYFHKLFKKYYHVSPSEYRDMHSSS